MRPDKKSTSFTWLQAPKRFGNQLERPGMREDTQHMMEVEEAPSPTNSTAAATENENNLRKGKRMTRMGASSLMRRATSTVRAYQYLEPQNMEFTEEDNIIEEENGFNDISGSSKGSHVGVSIGKKFNKTFKDVKMSIGNLSQKLRRSTRRRYAMGESSSYVDLTPTRRILGRTPTKLYSPFGFDSPSAKGGKRCMTPSTPMLSRKMSTPGRVYTPSSSERNSVKSRIGLRELRNSPLNRKSFRF